MTCYCNECQEKREMKISKRGKEWQLFSLCVQGHIENYTVPQYGDYPSDQLSSFSPEEIVSNMKRYLNRAGRNSRGKEEELRDCLKLAHYSGVLYFKLCGDVPEVV